MCLDDALPIGAGADGFFGPPLAVMRGCADNGERSGAAMWQAPSGGHSVRLRCCQQASLVGRDTRSSSEILLRAEARTCTSMTMIVQFAPLGRGIFLCSELLVWTVIER